MFLVISQHKHRLGHNVDVTVLHTAPVIILVLTFQPVIVRYHNLAVIIHILVRLLTCLVLIVSSLFLHSILHIQMGLQHYQFIGLSSLSVTYLFTGCRTELITRQEIRIFFEHGGIILDSPSEVACLVEQQTTVEDGHHIVRFHLNHKVEVLNGTVVIPHLGTEQTTVIVTNEIIGIHIQCQVIIRHRSTQVVLMIACQSTVDIQTRITHRKMDGLTQVRFRFLVSLGHEIEHGS